MHFQSLYHYMLTWSLRTRHQQIQLIIQGKALLATQSYLYLLHLFEDEFHGDLSFVLHFQHASAVGIHCSFQDVQLLELLESQHLR